MVESKKPVFVVELTLRQAVAVTRVCQTEMDGEHPDRKALGEVNVKLRKMGVRL